jgi:hypothetical protein
MVFASIKAAGLPYQAIVSRARDGALKQFSGRAPRFTAARPPSPAAARIGHPQDSEIAVSQDRRLGWQPVHGFLRQLLFADGLWGPYMGPHCGSSARAVSTSCKTTIFNTGQIDVRPAAPLQAQHLTHSAGDSRARLSAQYRAPSGVPGSSHPCVRRCDVSARAGSSATTAGLPLGPAVIRPPPGCPRRAIAV